MTRYSTLCDSYGSYKTLPAALAAGALATVANAVFRHGESLHAAMTEDTRRGLAIGFYAFLVSAYGEGMAISHAREQRLSAHVGTRVVHRVGLAAFFGGVALSSLWFPHPEEKHGGTMENVRTPAAQTAPR